MSGRLFIDIACRKRCGDGQTPCGKTFLQRRCADDDRMTVALTDVLPGGGEGETFVEIDRPGRQATIVECDDLRTFVLRNGQLLTAKRKCRITGEAQGIRRLLYTSWFNIEVGDRIVLATEGVLRGGWGSNRFPFGWGADGAAAFAQALITEDPAMSSAALSTALIGRAVANDGGNSAGDLAVAVIHLRRARSVSLFSGIEPSGEGETDLFDGEAIALDDLSAFDRVCVMLADRREFLFDPSPEAEICRKLTGGDRVMIRAGMCEAAKSGISPFDVKTRCDLSVRMAALLEEQYGKEVDLLFV
ncbi:MAG: hypothetical protein LBU80_02965 [Rikenellaceae bacterium]|jgi:hypothetical protein|nr:hypothetical protein [Rikenellaceae bacterium]